MVENPTILCRLTRLGLILVLGIGTLTFGTGRADTIDELFAVVAERVPEFGGMYVDEEQGIRYVYLRSRDPATTAAVVAALRSVLGDQQLTRDTVRVLPAKFDFLALKRWHVRIDADVLQLPGVVLTAIDHAQNRLVIGVRDTQVRTRVEQQLAELGVPRDAVNFVEAGPIQLDQAPGTNLADHHRPVVGGLRIRFAEGTPDDAQCTLGFIAKRRGVLGFVTASHCSKRWGFGDNTVYNQPGGSNPIGEEAFDLRFQATCDCIPFTNFCTTFCRQSDSNFSKVFSSVPAKLGFIARPLASSFRWDGVSTFRIVAKARGAYVGSRVTKVGSFTGKTVGTVQFSSVSISLNEAVHKPGRPGAGSLRNQVLANYRWIFGDSGSPIITGWFLNDKQDGSALNTSLQGIHHGGVPIFGIGLYSIFSPIGGVERDLGPLDVTAPMAPTANLVPTSPPNSVQFCRVVDNRRHAVVRVENVGDTFAAASITTVDFSPFSCPGRPGVPACELRTVGILPGSRVDLPPIPLSPDCFNPTCDFRVEVDRFNSVDEGPAGERRNTASGRCD